MKIVDWTLTQDVRLTPLVHNSKDGIKEEGEVDEGDRVLRCLKRPVWEWHCS